jgi:hypothetical protein
MLVGKRTALLRSESAWRAHCDERSRRTGRKVEASWNLGLFPSKVVVIVGAELV